MYGAEGLPAISDQFVFSITITNTVRIVADPGPRGCRIPGPWAHASPARPCEQPSTASSDATRPAVHFMNAILSVGEFTRQRRALRSRPADSICRRPPPSTAAWFGPGHGSRSVIWSDSGGRMRYPLMLATFVALACSGVAAPVPAAGGADAGSPAGNGADGGGTQSAGPTSTPATGTGLIPATADGWRTLAPRAVSAPGVSVTKGADGYVLNASGRGIANVYGGWTTHIGGLQGGSYYRFTARARPVNIASIRESVSILLRWRGSFGDEEQPDYVWSFEKQQDGSVLFDRTLQAPAGTSAVDVELALQWSPDGQVAFDKLSFASAAAPSGRKVRVASIYYRPSGTRSGLDSVQQAGHYAEQVAATNHPDLMVLGELLNSIGAPGTVDANAETVPGPSTDFMAGIARANHVNLVFGMVERAGDMLFNTAVLIDRSGNIAGQYQKVQPPITDAVAGLMPGDSVPVFDPDFGKVALLICQDF